MALFEIVLASTYMGQKCINRWNYVSSGTPAAVSLSLALARAGGFLPSGEPPIFPSNTLFSRIRDISITGVVYTELIVNNVKTLTDFYTTAFPNPTTGATNVAGNSPFEAAGFRTNKVRRDVARGTKRFAGVPMTASTNGGVLVSEYVDAMELLATKMSENLTYDDEGNTITFIPCVCGKEKYTTPSGKTAYKYYGTLAEQLEHTAQGIFWEVYSNIRSQTSRQIGKGA